MNDRVESIENKHRWGRQKYMLLIWEERIEGEICLRLLKGYEEEGLILNCQSRGMSEEHSVGRAQCEEAGGPLFSLSK